MAAIAGEQAFRQHTFIVIDFETLTPASRAPEPTEVAAVALTPANRGLVESWRFERLIAPPDGLAPTPRDVAQTGITPAMLASATSAAVVLADLDGRLTSPPYRLVAHNAPYEASIIGRHRQHCPHLAVTRMLDTVRLARIVLPGLTSHRLDALLANYRIPMPSHRHRAMPDVDVTANILRRLLDDAEAIGISTLSSLDQIAGLQPPPTSTDSAHVQQTLF